MEEIETRLIRPMNVLDDEEEGRVARYGQAFRPNFRKALKKNVELVFLFQKPFSPMPGARVRRDGTKRTHAEWAEKNNFLWYSEDTLPEEWK